MATQLKIINSKNTVLCIIYKGKYLFQIIVGCFFLYSPLIYGQSYISGCIKDTSGKPIIGASISLINISNQSGIIFTKSSEKGYYSISLPIASIIDSLAIRVNALGYKKEIRLILRNQERIDFTLEYEQIELPSVRVQNSKLLNGLNGDTLRYNVSDLVKGGERVIGDILKNIQGVEIDKNGTISYLDKPINFLYIDGENLVDDKYSIATKNISIENIEKIQVIQNNQHVKLLNGIIPSESPAINLISVNNNKLNISNNISAGIGIPKIIDLNFNSIILKRNYKAINTIKYNNLGYQNSEEVFSHKVNNNTQGVDRPVSRHLASIAPNEPMELPRNRFINNSSFLSGFNNLFKLDEFTSLKLNTYLIPESENIRYSSIFSFILPIDTLKYIDNQLFERESQKLRIAANYLVNSKKKYFNNLLTFDYNQIKDKSNGLFQNDNINSILNSSLKNISNLFESITLIKRKRVIDFQSIISLSTQPQLLDIFPGILPGLFNQGIPYKRTSQVIKSPSFMTNNSIGFKVSKERVLKEYKIGFYLEKSKLGSNIFINESTKKESDSFSNNLIVNNFLFYIDRSNRYEFTKHTFEISFPISFQYVSYMDTIHKLVDSKELVTLNPSLKWRFQMNPQNAITLSYQNSTTLTDLDQLYRGAVITSYKAFNSNNRDIQQSNFQMYNLVYEIKKPLRFFFAKFSVNYLLRKINYIQKSTLSQEIISNELVPIHNNQNTRSISLVFSKYLTKFKTNFLLHYRYQGIGSLQFQNGNLFSTNLNLFTFSQSLSSKPVKNIIFNQQLTSLTTKNFRNQKTSSTKIQFNISYTVNEKVFINISTEYLNNRAENQLITRFNCYDLSVRFKGKAIDIDLSYLNIFNKKIFEIYNSTANVMFGSTYWIRPATLFIRATKKI